MTAPVQMKPAESVGRRAMWLAFASVVMTFALPLAGLVMSLFALFIAIRAIPTLRSAGKPAGLAVLGLVLSSLSLLTALAVSGMQFYFGDELAAYTECRKGAGTLTAQDQCVEHLERAMERKMPFVQPGQLQFPFPP